MPKWNRVSTVWPNHEQVVLTRSRVTLNRDGRSCVYCNYRLLKFINMGLECPRKYHSDYVVFRHVNVDLRSSDHGILDDIESFEDLQWMSIDDDA